MIRRYSNYPKSLAAAIPTAKISSYLPNSFELYSILLHKFFLCVRRFFLPGHRITQHTHTHVHMMIQLSVGGKGKKFRRITKEPPTAYISGMRIWWDRRLLQWHQTWEPELCFCRHLDAIYASCGNCGALTVLGALPFWLYLLSPPPPHPPSPTEWAAEEEAERTALSIASQIGWRTLEVRLLCALPAGCAGNCCVGQDQRPTSSPPPPTPLGTFLSHSIFPREREARRHSSAPPLSRPPPPCMIEPWQRERERGGRLTESAEWCLNFYTRSGWGEELLIFFYFSNYADQRSENC